MSYFTQKIHWCQRRTENILITMKGIEAKYEAQDPRFKDELLEISVLTERMCLELRKLLALSGCETKRDYLSKLSILHEIQVEERDGRTYLTLPVLPLKKNSHTSSDFTMDPLIARLKDYQKNNTCRVYDKARITICHCYPEGTPAKKLRDCDNIEVKKMLDVLALYFLKDDNMARCEILQTSRPDEDYKTEITISNWGENQ